MCHFIFNLVERSWVDGYWFAFTRKVLPFLSILFSLFYFHYHIISEYYSLTPLCSVHTKKALYKVFLSYGLDLIFILRLPCTKVALTKLLAGMIGV